MRNQDQSSIVSWVVAKRNQDQSSIASWVVAKRNQDQMSIASWVFHSFVWFTAKTLDLFACLTRKLSKCHLLRGREAAPSGGQIHLLHMLISSCSKAIAEAAPNSPLSPSTTA
ncbi:hypothetical protein AVEN_155167-1 [Araneus ventricosus]|uniref:Uncharacterized protein n=2 Tax=Araneus ventricosus TaxID=182803 RepID=A0A4Y2Q7N3_ARAVE|nr:hypothetical protein AVEN_127695-1 [Araneus ventricosus]GBN59570.1 hypothetical protein AVEN_98235-1 [Araneus ventricosus]GBN59579.1 hypothetical protein AVEN_155167-1 [Araneus ventricosus]